MTRAQVWTPFASEIIALRGKRPLSKGWAEWHGTPQGLARFEADGHNFGMLARRYPGLDIDVTLTGLAHICEQEALRILGPAPRRGRAHTSKCLFMYRTDETLRKRRIEFTAQDGSKHAVELLATGQQYVVDGEHPDGGRYVWT